jgi:hypothetical protein
MSMLRFSKYQGTGNDFLLGDNRTGLYQDLSQQLIQKLCDRRFGIGADGLILLENNEHADFSMKYFNEEEERISDRWTVRDQLSLGGTSHLTESVLRMLVFDLLKGVLLGMLVSIIFILINKRKS